MEAGGGGSIFCELMVPAPLPAAPEEVNKRLIKVNKQLTEMLTAPGECERPGVHGVVRRDRRRGVREVPVGRRGAVRRAVDRRRDRLQAGALALRGGGRRPVRIEHVLY